MTQISSSETAALIRKAPSQSTFTSRRTTGTQSSSSETAALMTNAPDQSTLTSRLTTGSFRVFWSTISAMIAKGTPT